MMAKSKTQIKKEIWRLTYAFSVEDDSEKLAYITGQREALEWVLNDGKD